MTFFVKFRDFVDRLTDRRAKALDLKLGPYPLSNELITSAMNGKNETRFLRIWFQLLPEMDDMRVNCPSIWIVVITPHRVQKPIAAERFRGMRNEVAEQRELF